MPFVILASVWRPRAAALAASVCAEAPSWADAVATTPRHLLVPRWWSRDTVGRWDLHQGPEGHEAWLDAAYSDETLVTRVGPLHADHASVGQEGIGEPTSSSTLPGLVITMLRHLDPRPGVNVLDIATGSGYSAAILAQRLGDDAVLSVDVDSYLTNAATERLAAIGRHPRIETVDATGPLPATGYDALVATVATRGVPPSWLAALRPGARLVTTVADTSLMIVADVGQDGTAQGVVVPDHGRFMPVRRGDDYVSRLPEGYQLAREGEGESVTIGRRPVPDWWNEWQLATMVSLALPGMEIRTQQSGNGERQFWLLHPDGSWARCQGKGGELPIVHQTGPRRLWDELEQTEARWNAAGRFDPRQLTARFSAAESTLTAPGGKWSITL